MKFYIIQIYIETKTTHEFKKKKDFFLVSYQRTNTDLLTDRQT